MTADISRTNGGFLLNVGEIVQEVDLPPGSYKPGSVSMQVQNRENIFSAEIFNPDSVSAVELRMWLSYDQGTSWEYLFVGFITLSTVRGPKHVSAISQSTTYNFTATEAMLSLRSQTLDFSSNPITSFGTNVYPGGTGPVPQYNTDTAGSAYLVDPNTRYTNRYGGSSNLLAVYFAQIENILLNSLGYIPWIAPSTNEALDYSTLQHSFYDANSAASYTFDKLCLLYDSLTNFGMFGNRAGPAGALDAKNPLEFIKRLLSTLLIVPVPRLTVSGSSSTYTMHLFHRVSSATPAVSSPPSLQLAEEFEPAPWGSGVKVETIGLPLKAESAAKLGGRQIDHTAYLTTSPNPFNITLLWNGVYLQQSNASEAFFLNEFMHTTQMFVRTGPANVGNVHQVKLQGNQSFQSTGGAGFYGVQDALYDLIWGSTSRNIYGDYKTGYNAEYYGLRGADLWDLRILKKITINGDDCIISRVARNLANNMTKIRALKLAA